MKLELGYAIIDKKTMHVEKGHAYSVGAKLYGSKSMALSVARRHTTRGTPLEPVKLTDKQLEAMFHFPLVSVEINT